jgi:hypothetical protein
MENTRKITNILTLTVVFCLVLGQVAQAEEKAKSLKWIEHKPNPRFAIYDPGTPGNNSDDLVLDRKTGLIWVRNAHLVGKRLTWEDAVNYCKDLAMGNFKGWRLPTLKELKSLLDPFESNPSLSKGHPFIIVKYGYWTGTTYEEFSDDAYHVDFGPGVVFGFPKIHKCYVWPVLEK